MDNLRTHTQVLIIGSGIAGSTAALCLAKAGLQVTLINSGQTLNGGNSELAQGGIIYEAAGGNDAQALAKDIYVAGHHYNYTKAVEFLCEQGPRAVEKILINDVGIPFDKNKDSSWNLTREGGHGAYRILHAADYTGRAIMEGLLARVAEEPNIRTRTQHHAVTLLTTHQHTRQSQFCYELENRCLGAYVYNNHTGNTETILADWTILASGGVGQVFLYTTNSAGCVGSGIAMAYRAGVALNNLEFMQFHPTTLYHPQSYRRALITEAMRGEGARLVDSKGNPFMQRYDTRGDLAPRDVVAQAIKQEMNSTKVPCLFLDTSQMQLDLPTRFPSVYKDCMEIGIDMRKDRIPIVPAAHYFCGGILTDIHGRTTLQGLYAVGECACTGLHGANRLASTSLLEGLTWGSSCAHDLLARVAHEAPPSTKLCNIIPNWEKADNNEYADPTLIAQDWAYIRHTMWNYVGIDRSTARLERARKDLHELVQRIHHFYKGYRLSPELIHLFHGAHTAYAITQAALRNKNSLGCHHRIN